jgi:pilus assembly protein Flp/PilA
LDAGRPGPSSAEPASDGKQSEGEEVIAMQARAGAPGQGLVEYALILVLVAVVVILILGILGNSIGNVFSNILSYL